MATKQELEQELAQLKQQLETVQKTAKIGVNLKLPITLRDKLRAAAATQGTTMGEIAEKAITQYLDQ